MIELTILSRIESEIFIKAQGMGGKKTSFDHPVGSSKKYRIFLARAFFSKSRLSM